MEKPETIEKLAELVVDFLGNLDKLHNGDQTRVALALKRTITYYILERVKKDKRDQFLDIFCNNLRSNVVNLEHINYDAAENI